MDWNQLRGHAGPKAWFAAAIRQKRIGSGFLFVGPTGVGKHTFALLLAKTLFCERSPAEAMAPCGVCQSCIQVEALTHPDLILVQKPADRSMFPIELIAGDRESRMQTGLCHDLHMSPQQAKRRIAILSDADLLTVEAANAMLKTLEEPPPGAILILIGTSPQKQLPTIRSRCQVVRFDPPPIEDAIALLEARGLQADHETLRTALELAGGDLVEASRMLDPEVCEFRNQLKELLAQEPPEATAMARLVTGYVGVAGEDALGKRERFRDAALAAIAEFRRQIRYRVDQGHDVSSAMARLERTLMALQHVDRSANSATLIESWAIDLQVS